ncbi:MAG: ABC transporter permease [Gemmataceae bacterium]
MMKRNLIRLAGVVHLIIILFALLAYANPAAIGQSNLYDVLNRHGALGVITLGAALLIVVGAIDLSIGSVVGFAAVLFGVLMESGITIKIKAGGNVLFNIDTGPFHPYAAFAFTIACGILIGLINGTLVTRLRLQAFLVTLCGMFIYRGLSRTLTAKQTGLVQVKDMHPDYTHALDTLRYWLVGKGENGELIFPVTLVVLAVLCVFLGIFLHKSAFGRYWYAIGYNEQAARYAGVHVERMKIAAFIISSALASFAGILYLLDYGSANPSEAGSTYELYAITAAVLGGCSLRGGEGLVIGFFLGALVQPLMRNLMTFWDIPSSSEPWVMGLILLLGTIADEMIRRRSKR